MRAHRFGEDTHRFGRQRLSHSWYQLALNLNPTKQNVWIFQKQIFPMLFSSSSDLQIVYRRLEPSTEESKREP